MWRPGDAEREAKLDRQIIGGVIDRDDVGRKLTPEARDKAITAGVRAYKGARIGSGDAGRIGIEQVTGEVLKR